MEDMKYPKLIITPGDDVLQFVKENKNGTLYYKHPFGGIDANVKIEQLGTLYRIYET